MSVNLLLSKPPKLWSSLQAQSIDCAQFVQASPITDTERNTLTSGTGTIIYSSTDDDFQGYNGSSWKSFTSGPTGSQGPTGPTGATGPTGTSQNKFATFGVLNNAEVISSMDGTYYGDLPGATATVQLGTTGQNNLIAGQYIIIANFTGNTFFVDSNFNDYTTALGPVNVYKLPPNGSYTQFIAANNDTVLRMGWTITSSGPG